MWSALARIFTKNEADSGGGDWETEESMDRGEMRRADLEMQDSYDTSQVGKPKEADSVHTTYMGD